MPIAQAKCDIFRYVNVGEERIILEDHADLALFWWCEMPVVRYDAIADPDETASRLLKAGQEAQGCCLATTARSEDGHELASLHIERDISYGGHAIVKQFGQIVGLQREFHRKGNVQSWVRKSSIRQNLKA